ncbi:uncharacterized protein LOC117730437 [Cyclopterus lumpus]|uniref:uncharacterized protein LOC117730437 n=1 Tax=Cyclopterus lumpus TaxID=8103 RepID=UPI0014864225|nr:uncharacterized protein LOC117730437 [Cyclopterus lumpus]
MAKGKAKTNNSNGNIAPAQPRSLRSKKRGCPSDEISETDDIKASHHQDTEGNHTTVDATVLQCHHSPLQESTVKAFEETTVTNPSNDSQLKGLKVHADNDANKSGKDKEEMTAEECNASPSQTCTDQLQVLQISQEGDDAALEDQPGAEENSECNSEKNQDVSQEEPSNVDMTDVKETTKERAAGIPAKKKRRMGMCGLMERERSHFLQTQKRENGQNGPERVGKQICNNTADLVAQEEIISSLSSSLSVPVGNVTEQEKAEMKLQSSHCGGEDRTETEVHIAANTSDGISVVSDPGCSKDKSCEVEGGIGPGPEQTGDTKSDLPAGEEEEDMLGNQDQQEHEGGTAEIVAENFQEQMQDREDRSAAVQSPAITCSSHTTQREETENWDAIEAASLQVSSVTRTREEELTGDAGDDGVAEAGASSTHTQSGGPKAVQHCEAAGTPSGSEMKDNCDSDGEPGAGPSSVNSEPPLTRDTTDPFGSGSLDYVSDSQLNTIILSEEVLMEREDRDCPDHEDATDLICGLIRELSTLNRKVMATHRELENRRRSSKSSRGCKR